MKKEALVDLKEYYEIPVIDHYYLSGIKNMPLGDNLRDDPKFQQIFRDVEAKYLAEHERVRQWLEENDMF